MHLKVKDSIRFDIFIQRLIEMGYQRRPVASDKGEFAIRGGIIDVFPVSTPDPFRIEFWGDVSNPYEFMIQSVKNRSVLLKHWKFTPAKELELLGKEAQLSTILDYLDLRLLSSLTIC